MRRLMLLASVSMVGLPGIGTAAPLPDGSVLIITPVAGTAGKVHAEQVPLRLGSEYRVPAGGSLELAFADGASIWLSERSAVTVDAGPTINFEPGDGSAYILTPETVGIEVKTPVGRITTRPGGALVRLDGSQTTVAAAWGRPILVRESDKTIEVPSGEQLTLDEDGGVRSIGPILEDPSGRSVASFGRAVSASAVVQSTPAPELSNASLSLSPPDLLDNSSYLNESSILGNASLVMLASAGVSTSTSTSTFIAYFVDAAGLSYFYAGTPLYSLPSAGTASYVGAFTYAPTTVIGSTSSQDAGTLNGMIDFGARTASVQVVAGGIVFSGAGITVSIPSNSDNPLYFPVRLMNIPNNGVLTASGAFGGPSTNPVVFDLFSANFQIAGVAYSGSGTALIVVDGFTLGAPALDLSTLPMSGTASFNGSFTLTSGSTNGTVGTLKSTVDFGARTAATQIALPGLNFSGTNPVPVSGPTFAVSLPSNVADTNLQGIGYFVQPSPPGTVGLAPPTTSPILQVRANILKGGAVIASGSGTGK